MAFIETPRFPDDISYGSTGGPSWSTDVLTLKSGYESRNANWGQMRYRFNAAMGVRDNTQLDDLIHWFNATQGRAHGFRFKDWTDYTSSVLGVVPAEDDQIIGIGDGVEDQFQLIKTYVQGSVSRIREIFKPVANTVTIAVDGNLLETGWAVNTATGIITFDTPPGIGDVITSGYEFDIPVRFDTDTLSIAIEHYLTGSLSVPLVELRV